MAPRRSNSSGFHGARVPVAATSEICASIDRIFLGTFETTHEAPRTFDAAAWCLGCLHREMNFDDVQTRE
jgi:hypothetical protein